MGSVLAFDLGKNLGWALLGRDAKRPNVGSELVVKEWSPLGPCLLVLEDRLHKLILRHKPDAVAVAVPFVRKSKQKMFDTTRNLVPMYGGYAVLVMICASMGLGIIPIWEGEARKKLVGADNLRRKSADQKEDVMNAFRDRGIEVGNDHEGDALCIAYAAWEEMHPAASYKTTPLFNEAPTVRLRRSKTKKAA